MRRYLIGNARWIVLQSTDPALLLRSEPFVKHDRRIHRNPLAAIMHLDRAVVLVDPDFLAGILPRHRVAAGLARPHTHPGPVIGELSSPL